MKGLTDDGEVLRRDEGRGGVSEITSARVDYRDTVPVARVAGEDYLIQSQALRDRLLAAVRNKDLDLVVELTAPPTSTAPVSACCSSSPSG